MDLPDLPEERQPTALDRWFFTPLYFPRSAWSVVKWWEQRRPLYNASVGAAGLVSITAMMVASPEAPLQLEVLIPIAVYGGLANFMYSFGAPVDLLLRKLLGDRAAAAGPALFRYGFVFSLGLTLLPVPLSLLLLLAKLFF